ncbi:hypothetical protein [Nocardioides pinisoli]|uniref:Sugar ABC transporter ATPase n=1 Tax=Nocardioides pinisoli TaxID=2950279 RepID=A0ABT1KZL5_9ACTN|nr:hypothetical protein [Nocardioides pinisoli]MCP3423202.1 hypothetical protein [Nocardioides pinisoli]
MTNEELSPMPEPYAEEPQLVPGGVDALEDDPADTGLARDLDPDDNPAVDDVLPDEIAEPDEKPQAPDGETEDKESDTPRAGQEAEDGSPEPPA